MIERLPSRLRLIEAPLDRIGHLERDLGAHDGGGVEVFLKVQRNLGRQRRRAIDHDGRNRAYYNPPADSIHLPPQSAFESPDEYYSTLFHELGSPGMAARENTIVSLSSIRRARRTPRSSSDAVG